MAPKTPQKTFFHVGGQTADNTRLGRGEEGVGPLGGRDGSSLTKFRSDAACPTQSSQHSVPRFLENCVNRPFVMMCNGIVGVVPLGLQQQQHECSVRTGRRWRELRLKNKLNARIQPRVSEWRFLSSDVSAKHCLLGHPKLISGNAASVNAADEERVDFLDTRCRPDPCRGYDACSLSAGESGRIPVPMGGEGCC